MLKFFTAVAISSAVLYAVPGVAGQADVQIGADVLKTLHTRGTATLTVYLDERADLAPAAALSWDARGRFVYRRLTEVAERSQAPLRAYLDQAGVDYRAFWIDNAIVVEQAGWETLNTLRGMSGIRAIRGESGSRLMTPGVLSLPPMATQPGEARPGIQNQPAASNIAHIGAPAVWEMGHTGQGITIGIIDSGVRHTHEALVAQYRGHLGEGAFEHDYHWFDAETGSHEPRFPDPHGTHVTGTAVGRGNPGVGVAPEAQWIACLACPDTGCPDSYLLACAEFMLAPTDTEGNHPDPDRRPHVVNNSWGDCAVDYNDWFQAAVDAWIAAGMVPVFSAGNAPACGYPRPPGLNTVGNPARYGTVLAVGSTGNSNGEYADHSHWGPTDNPSPGLPDYPDHGGFPAIKPNLVAPGVNIRSTVSNSDGAYQAGWTGTSMSAPHVSGLIALMWDAAPCLIGDYPTTGTLLMRSARPIDFDSGGDPSPGPDNRPNYATGWGELDAVAAVAAAIERCTPGIDLEAQPAQLDLCTGTPAHYDIHVRGREMFDDPVSLSVSAGLPAAAGAEFTPNPVIPADPAAPSTLEIGGDLAAGLYTLHIQAASEGPAFDPVTETAEVTLRVVEQAPLEATPVAPAIGAGEQPLRPAFVWQPQDNAAAYRFQLADNREFDPVIADLTVADAALTPDIELAPAGSYYWRVAAGNACGAGAFSPPHRFTTRSDPGVCPLGTAPVTLLHEDFSGGAWPAGWNTADATGGAWTVSDLRSHQGGYSAFAPGVEQVSDRRLTLPAVDMPAQADALRLNFHTWQSIEAGGAVCFDAAVVEISADGGANWTRPAAGDILARPYDGPVSGDFLNPLAGTPAWCGDPREFWEQYSIDLSAYAGQRLHIRFRFATDNAVARTGWHVDTVEVLACGGLFRDRFRDDGSQ